MERGSHWPLFLYTGYWQCVRAVGAKQRHHTMAIGGRVERMCGQWSAAWKGPGRAVICQTECFLLWRQQWAYFWSFLVAWRPVWPFLDAWRPVWAEVPKAMLMLCVGCWTSEWRLTGVLRSLLAYLEVRPGSLSACLHLCAHSYICVGLQHFRSEMFLFFFFSFFLF